jgi:hypothetical protein
VAFGAAGIAAIEAVVGVFGRRGSRRSGRRGGGWGFRHAKWMAGAVYSSVIIVVEIYRTARGMKAVTGVGPCRFLLPSPSRYLNVGI